MSKQLQATLDSILKSTVEDSPQVPGVVAMVTDRNGTVYEGAAGVRRLGAAAPMSTDTVFAIFSTTKAITATAALQLVETGQLDLDAPAARYAPAIGQLQVLESVDEQGNARTRPPKTQVTTRQLLTHTGGFGYDFFNENYKRLADAGKQPSVITATRAALQTPLLFDPGERWEYGSNIDWVGQVVEGITGLRLGEVFRQRIFAPLGIEDMTFEINDRLRSRVAGMHARHPDGRLEAMDFELPAQPEVHCGGHGLYGTVGEYMKFIRMWLNDGAGPHGRVLKPETVAMACQRHLDPKLQVTMLPGVIKTLSNDAEFFPGLPQAWSLPFLINEAPAPTGRPAGAQGWAGLANLFYWVDRESGIGGFWATQILPFGDPGSFMGYVNFETATYQAYR